MIVFLIFGVGRDQTSNLLFDDRRFYFFFFFFREFQLMASAPDDSSFIIRPRHQSVFGVGSD